MSIPDYEGETFVAFLDIYRFKEFMSKKEKALDILDKFYSAGYNTLRSQENLNSYKVEGIFISDCGILFVRNASDNSNQIECLNSILKIIKNINKEMINNNVAITTSVAYGLFKYEDRITFKGITKTFMYGDTYVCAFLDNENGNPRIKPGQCRILIDGLPGVILQNISENREDLLGMIRKRDENDNHYYFYWMVNSSYRIKDFEEYYKKAVDFTYKGIIETLKGNRCTLNVEEDNI